MKRSVVFMFSLLLAPAWWAAAPTTAEACLHRDAFRRQVNPQLEQVRRAERLLARGSHQQAVHAARAAFPKLDAVQVDASESFDRAQRVVALAVARSDGAVWLGKRGKGSPSAEERRFNLAWATQVMQFQAARHADNVVVRVQYAEAAAHTPGFEAIAYGILVDLDAADLMPTARGYALLARLQQARGEAELERAALERCREITEDARECAVA